MKSTWKHFLDFCLIGSLFLLLYAAYARTKQNKPIPAPNDVQTDSAFLKAAEYFKKHPTKVRIAASSDTVHHRATTFTATVESPFNPKTYSYQWFRNGMEVGNGSRNYFLDSTVVAGDKIYCNLIIAKTSKVQSDTLVIEARL